MGTDRTKKTGRSLNMTSIFRCMMEGGYGPIYEKTHIIFGFDDNQGVVEYQEGVLSVRLFFSIDDDIYPLLLEAGNRTMIRAYSVKPAILDDRKNLMFSCETFCDTIREFRKFFPRSIELISEAVRIHRSQMRKLILEDESEIKNPPAADEISSLTGRSKNRKLFS